MIKTIHTSSIIKLTVRILNANIWISWSYWEILTAVDADDKLKRKFKKLCRISSQLQSYGCNNVNYGLLNKPAEFTQWSVFNFLCMKPLGFFMFRKTLEEHIAYDNLATFIITQLCSLNGGVGTKEKRGQKIWAKQLQKNTLPCDISGCKTPTNRAMRIKWSNIKAWTSHLTKQHLHTIL